MTGVFDRGVFDRGLFDRGLFDRGLWLMGRTIVGKCLFDFNMSREDVLRRSMCVGRAGFNSNSELKTRNSPAARISPAKSLYIKRKVYFSDGERMKSKLHFSHSRAV